MKKSLSIVLLLAVSSSSFGQRYMGVSTGGYNALSGVFLNPAHLGGCNEKLGVSLFSLNVGADNSLGTIKSIGDISKALNTGDSASSQDIFTYSNRQKFSLTLPVAEVRGPGVLYRINAQHTVALTTRVRAFNQFNNFDRTLYQTITQSDYAKQGVNAIQAQNFNWTAHVWSDVGLSYGGVPLTTDVLQVKVGATLHYLMGVGYLGLKGKNVDIYYQNGSDSFSARNSDIQFGSNAQSLEGAISNGITTSNLFGGKTGGKGFGIDLGAVVSLLPESEGGTVSNDDGKAGNDESYRLSLSAAVTDIGSITYKTSYNVNVTGNGYLTGRGLLDNLSNSGDLNNYVKTQGYSADTGVKATKVYLPAAMVIGADYHVYKHFYANATFFANMAGNNNFGNTYYNQLVVTPRYDTKLLTVGMPFTFNMLTNNLRLGLGFRVSGFFFGSDDMMALFSDNQYGFNFYFGGMVPIYRRSK